MSATITIELDNADRVYAAGDRLTGTVIVEATAPLKSKALTLKVHHVTHGRAATESKVEHLITLHEGATSAGTHRYRFDVALPAGPVTYRGALISLDWQLIASMDIPWAFDPTCELDFVLLPCSDLVAPHPPEDELTEKLTVPNNNVLFGIIGLVACGGLLWLLREGSIIFTIIAVLIGIASIVGIVLGVRARFAQHRTGKISIELPQIARIGDAIPCAVTFTPRAKLAITRATLTLSCIEQTITQSGTDHTTISHTHFEHTYDLGRNLICSTGNPTRLETSLQLPDDAPFTIDMGQNQVFWTARLHLDIVNWPDWTHERRVWMLPAGSKAIGAQPSREALPW